MAVESTSGNPIEEHPLLAKLLAEGGPDLKAYRGYVGPSSRDGHVTVYPSLADLGKSFEIRGADIVHVEEISEQFAPFGAVMIWVKPDADIASRVLATATRKASAGAPEMTEVRQGRLRMLRSAPAAKARGDCSVCTSNCDCVSNCDPCVSICVWTCEPHVQ